MNEFIYGANILIYGLFSSPKETKLMTADYDAIKNKIMLLGL